MLKICLDGVSLGQPVNLPDETPDYKFGSIEEFLAKFDLGVFDEQGTLSAEIRKLSPQQLENFAKILFKRKSDGEIPAGEIKR